ncbi:MAG: radical SAM/SPASM domain-containing protein [Candidatus Hodarchaeales archaeon]|jgi:molybdenum cofactor biosynthesis enzyme MoaA
MSELFQYIDFETISTCNRTCPTCIRNSHWNKNEIASWFEYNILSIDVIKEALDQCVEIGFTGGVCLSHYNEPLMDDRIVEIAKLVKSYNQFHPVFLNTNGDYLSKELAGALDGVLDRILVSLYMNEPMKSQRAKLLKSFFNKTDAQMITMSDHIATHFSPKFDVEALAKKHINHPCGEPRIRVIINHRRQFLLCCDDVIGNFDLGTFPETSIEEFWFGEKHMKIMNDLRHVGGRKKYSYCSTCPRI